VTNPATPTAQDGQRGPRRRKPPRPVEVVSVSRIAPRLVSVWVGGDALDGFKVEAPTSHIKVMLPPDGQRELVLPKDTPEGVVWPDEAVRPVVRTYTPRRFDEASRTLEIQFVLHGAGPASEWAERASVGDQLAVAGPGGRFTMDPAAGHWWIAGDESAIPAVGTLLEALPATATAEVHLEVADADDEIELDTPAKTAITWHHRRAPDAWGVELGEAARAADIADGTRVWVACEAAAMRGIRRYFIAERGLPAGSLVTRGYWRLGAANHPDHDYGDDDLGR
jgi:NADPH-dependent ferric siderophore reductase